MNNLNAINHNNIEPALVVEEHHYEPNLYEKSSNGQMNEHFSMIEFAMMNFRKSLEKY